MNREKLLKIVDDLEEFYVPNKVHQKHQTNKKAYISYRGDDDDGFYYRDLDDSYYRDEDDDVYDTINKLIDDSDFIKDPIDRIEFIIDELWDDYKNSSLELDKGDIATILSLLPRSRSKEYLSDIISQYGEIDNPSEKMGCMFKECGESLEDVPTEVLLNPDFLVEYIVSERSNDREIRNCSFLSPFVTKDILIEKVKKGYAPNFSLNRVKEIVERKKIMNQNIE